MTTPRKAIRQPKTTCECGKKMTREDAAFWGECEDCRQRLPIHSQGCDPVSETSARYHGDFSWRVE